LIFWKPRDGRDPREFGAMDIEDHVNDRVLKEKYVNTMFDVLAPGYNLFTRVFSFGMDQRWKAQLIEEGTRRVGQASHIVDLACGTGDIAAKVARRTGAAVALGLDFSLQMLVEAKSCLRGQAVPVDLVACNMRQLCIRDQSVDIVSVGYGLRNTSDFGEALREIARVLKPGGVLLSLDFYKPARRAWRELFLWYMWHAGRLVGWLWYGEPMAYGYISHSIRRYLTIPEFEDALRAAGLQIEWRQSRLGGGIGLHVARRRMESRAGGPPSC
jgi:demethylmenaquinone methyltransferase/2-methoxy-6-polyprenyl-1,4-benzoquinol methylase